MKDFLVIAIFSALIAAAAPPNPCDTCQDSHCQKTLGPKGVYDCIYKFCKVEVRRK